MKRFTKHLALLLAMCLLMTALFVPTGAMATGAGEYIANGGSDATSTTFLQWDCTGGQVAVSQETGTYGDAIGLTTGVAGCHWNWYKTALTVNVPEDYDVSKATGFAFYAKFPNVEADTALDIQWYINDNAYWHELCQQQPLYYMEAGSKTLEESIFTWGDYTLPGHNKAGWEGFIFVPFTTLNFKYNGEDLDIISAARNFQLRLSVCREDDALAEQTFIFDELGLYTTPADYVKAAVVHKNTHLVVNEGNDMALVKPQWNCTDQVTVEVVDDVSPYGKAYAMTAGDEGCGWNGYKTGFVAPRGDNDISEMKGFAFYAEAPALENGNPLLDLYFWNTDSRCWNTFVNGQPIYYLANGSDELTSVIFGGGDFPLANKPGFKGFVFIPFTSMQTTWGGCEGIDATNMNAYDSFEVRLSIADTNPALANQTFIIDEIGFYTDELEYAAFVEADSKTRNYAEPIELVANDASVFNSWSDYNEHFTVSSTAAPNTGRAYSLYSGGENPNYYWAHFPMPKGDADVSATNGVAFYAEIPDDLDECRLQVRFYIDDDHFYNDPILNKMYYVADGSTTVEEETIQQGYYPFQGRKGFKGWFFLPYGAMQRNGVTTNAAAVNAAENFRIQVCVISGNPADHNREYIIDQVGYYSDPLSYIETATKDYGAFGDVDGDDSIGATDLAYACKVIIGINNADDKIYQACDLNKDGYINVLDVIRFKKLLA